MTISPSIGFHFKKKIDLRHRRALKDSLEKLFKAEKRKMAGVQYVFCSDPFLLSINRRFLQHDFYTDIITFPMSEPGQPIVAEIYISVDRVRENARDWDNPVREELLRVIFHGALHLCGYKDKTSSEKRRMRSLEEKYLRRHLFHVKHTEKE